MKWKTVVNTGAERGFVAVRNDSGTALSAGQVVCWDMAGTEDGFRVIDPGSTIAGLVAGLAHSATPNGSKGLVQVYGVDDDALVCQCGSASNDPVEVGDLLDIYSAGSALLWAKAGGAVIAAASNAVAIAPMFVAAESVASTGTAASLTPVAKKVFVRCL